MVYCRSRRPAVGLDGWRCAAMAATAVGAMAAAALLPQGSAFANPLTAVSVLNPVAKARSELLAPLAAKLEPALLERLERGHMTRVLIELDPDAVAGAGVFARLASPARRSVLSELRATLNTALRGRGVLEGPDLAALPYAAARVSAEAAAAIAAYPWVKMIGTDPGGRALLREAVPLIGADLLFAQGFRGAAGTVAVLDSGYDSQHPDLAGGLLDEHCFCLGTRTPTCPFSFRAQCPCCPNGDTEQGGEGSAKDGFGHGSHISGIVTSDGIVAPRGVAPEAGIVAVKVLDDNGRFVSTAFLVAALDWVRTQHPEVDVVNMSLRTGGGDSSGPCDNSGVAARLFRDAVAQLRAAGILVVAASGNGGSKSKISFPACLSKVLSVAAVWDSSTLNLSSGSARSSPVVDEITWFSDTNAFTDILAPGAVIDSVGLGGGVAAMLGTSQAAGVVSACIALLRSIDPQASPAEIESALKASPVRIAREQGGYEIPRLDCAHAAALLLPPTTLAPSTTTTTTSSSSTTILGVLCGDANADGLLSSTDALATLQAAVAGAGSCDPRRCDVDGNGVVSVTDALLVLKAAVGQSVDLRCPAS